ncbi:MAG: LacI family DNA-binding transcriptional regulator [Armatimonadota bacterium]|jgi:LacI family transcriptional regulator
MATMRDIANEVGVAVSTVSRVLNGSPDARVTDQVRERILAAADELGYSPNIYARNLALGRGSHITVCNWTAMTHIAAHRAREIQQAATDTGRAVVAIDAASLSSVPDDLVRVVVSQLPAACVLVSGGWRPPQMVPAVTKLHQHGVHCLVVDSSWPLDPSVPCDTVRADRTQGAALAVSHLIERGHRHIGLVSLLRITGRLEGYKKALDEHGISERYIAPLDPEIPYRDDVALTECARRQVHDLLTENPQITALFCSSDVLALAGMGAVQELGRRVPDDVAIVGFDNDTFGGFLPVPLTTIEHPLDEFHEMTTRLLSARLDGDDGPWRRERAKYRLIERASTAPTEGGVEEAAN